MSEVKSKGGRPPAEDPRVAGITIKLTAAELASVRIKASLLGITVPALLRRGLAPEAGLTRGDVGASGTTRRA